MIQERVDFDVIVIGGSYAGLSAAMALGRSLRNVLVIDSNSPCNHQTPHSHNFITQDGEAPLAIANKAKQQVLNYDTVVFKNDLVVDGKEKNKGFEILTESGKTYHGKRIIFATGVKDNIPNIPGFAECWGISVIHCPYCHGYEVKNQKTGILANGDFAYHYVQLIKKLTSDIVVFTNGKAYFTKEQWDKFALYNIPVIEKEIENIHHQDGLLYEVQFKDNSITNLKVIYSRPLFEQHSTLPEKIGCQLTGSRSFIYR
ncbi:MAG: NAD(P)/FAD-dependent oxidoreductase [Sphingobacterium composti]|uniref:NAD(P)/FAD-dependent oxidoreductase n=1 Tax=Sphingobacterium composti TaxID=363260 RepID=UPI0019169C20|nr:NAD(P)/FAD-dependent oxidoreductase [Sphingobacterium composti Ten et al. 2007 non Yoo et al. 2007]